MLQFVGLPLPLRCGVIGLTKTKSRGALRCAQHCLLAAERGSRYQIMQGGETSCSAANKKAWRMAVCESASAEYKFTPFQ